MLGKKLPFSLSFSHMLRLEISVVVLLLFCLKFASSNDAEIPSEGCFNAWGDNQCKEKKDQCNKNEDGAKIVKVFCRKECGKCKGKHFLTLMHERKYMIPQDFL